MPPQSQTSTSDRRARVAELHAKGLGLQRIADDLGVGKTTIARDVRALGLQPHASGRPATLPPAAERACDHCGKRFTPKPRQVADGYGRFCTILCANRGKTYTRRKMRTATCAQCGTEYERWDAVMKRRGENDTLRSLFCSRECAGVYKWRGKDGKGAERTAALVAHLKDAGRWSPRALAVWEGRWGGHKGGRRPAKKTTRWEAQILRFLAEGKSDREIESITGVSRGSIRNLKKKHDVTC